MSGKERAERDAKAKFDWQVEFYRSTPPDADSRQVTRQWARMKVKQFRKYTTLRAPK